MLKISCYCCKFELLKFAPNLRHRLNPLTIYVCPLKLCEQNFQSVHAYKKYLEKHKSATSENFLEQTNHLANSEEPKLEKVPELKENVCKTN